MQHRQSRSRRASSDSVPHTVLTQTAERIQWGLLIRALGAATGRMAAVICCTIYSRLRAQCCQLPLYLVHHGAPVLHSAPLSIVQTRSLVNSSVLVVYASDHCVSRSLLCRLLGPPLLRPPLVVALNELLLQRRNLLIQPPLRLPLRLPPLAALSGAAQLVVLGLAASALTLTLELALCFALTQLLSLWFGALCGWS